LDAAAYLARIGHTGPVAPDRATLFALHRAHMRTVPFENLDIHLGRTLGLDLEATFAKVVGRRRGGWCYELNGLFAWLLSELGFAVELHGAQVLLSDQPSESELIHLTLRVDCEGTAWLCDVGFGDSPLEPTPLDSLDHGVLHHNGRTAYRYGTQVREYGEFQQMCTYLQTSPDSFFVRERICSLATPDGRITLNDLRLIETVDRIRSERALGSEDEWQSVLRDRFGVALYQE
jgi:N-hydroxyarylamine O-acetyltransferase